MNASRYFKYKGPIRLVGEEIAFRIDGEARLKVQEPVGTTSMIWQGILELDREFGDEVAKHLGKYRIETNRFLGTAYLHATDACIVSGRMVTKVWFNGIGPLDYERPKDN